MNQNDINLDAGVCINGRNIEPLYIFVTGTLHRRYTLYNSSEASDVGAGLAPQPKRGRFTERGKMCSGGKGWLQLRAFAHDCGASSRSSSGEWSETTRSSIKKAWSGVVLSQKSQDWPVSVSAPPAGH